MAETGGISSQRLKSFIDRIERLTGEKDSLSGDIREVYSESKSAGFDPKIIRAIIRLRKLDSADRKEQDELLDLYRRALGV